ncbi:uncharacterized protein ZBAI_06828 [Zygosaccharomyces bailii ISA1307]|nr:uncharacterized protein ZBAI_06828 [Zygosaccharomyces bailii ISA1307]
MLSKLERFQVHESLIVLYCEHSLKRVSEHTKKYADSSNPWRLQGRIQGLCLFIRKFLCGAQCPQPPCVQDVVLLFSPLEAVFGAVDTFSPVTYQVPYLFSCKLYHQKHPKDQAHGMYSAQNVSHPFRNLT